MKFVTIVFLCLFNIALMAQKVESKTYDVMLSNLLDHSVPEISVDELAAQSEDVLILDSRQREEYDVSHIQNSVWVGYDDFDTDRIPENAEDRKIVVYCSVGARSGKITKKLRESGYKNVSNLYGGIFEWVNQEYPVYNESGVTKKIHPYNFLWGVWLNEGEKTTDPE